MFVPTLLNVSVQINPQYKANGVSNSQENSQPRGLSNLKKTGSI
jgi:hypothetical protein